MAKFKVGDKVTDGDAVYLITGVTGLDYIWKCISGTPNPHWSKGGEKEWAEEQVEIANSCVENAAPRGLTSSSKLRLKEDFQDANGSYKKGSVFPIYAYGGISPKYGTMVVPGRSSTLEIPWEKLEVVNARTIATNDNPKYISLERELKNALTSHDENTIRSAVRKVESQGLEWVAQLDNGLLVDNVDWIVKDMKYNERNPHYIKAVRITDKGAMWNSCGCAVNSTREIVQKALNRKALNYADPNSLTVGAEVRDADTDTPNYGRVGKVIGSRNGFYHIKWNDGGDSWKKTTEITLNSVVAKNTQGDALSDAAHSMREAIKELNSSAQSLNQYFQYKLSDGASQKDIATDAKLRAEVKKAQSQLSSAINGITALEKTVSKLRDTADASGF